MKILIMAIMALGLLAGGEAHAKGCIKGAVVGGVAGHAVGHGKAGAAVGCVVGHRKAKKADEKRAPMN